MSSNVTKIEKQFIPRQADACPILTESKRKNLNRNPSLEKFKKFNTYICSQNYYILPALLAWLKTSQTVLQSYAKKCIFFVKSMIYHSLVYRTIESQGRRLVLRANFKGASLSDPKQLVRVVRMLIAKAYDSLTLISEEVRTKILTMIVYFAFVLIFLQLLACAYTLTVVHIPGGLAFFLAAVSYISYLNYTCLRFILIKQELKESEENRCDNSASEQYIRPKNILGKRTISNLNLF